MRTYSLRGLDVTTPAGLVENVRLVVDPNADGRLVDKRGTIVVGPEPVAAVDGPGRVDGRKSWTVTLGNGDEWVGVRRHGCGCGK